MAALIAKRRSLTDTRMRITNVIAIGAKANVQRLVILMHGVGANAADLEPVGEAIAAALPDTRVLLPDAPQPFDGGGPGFQWYSIAGATPENRRARVDEVLPGVVAWIEEQRNALHLTCEQLVVSGFSQGAILSLAAVARGLACGHILAFSGRLVEPVVKASNAAPRIFLGHGENDAVIPVSESQAAAAKLQAAGYAVELHTYRGLAHSIAPAELDAAIASLRRR